MGKGGVDDAHFHRDAIDCREGEADDEVEGADAAGYRDCKAEAADEREEKGVDEVEAVKERCGPHDGCCHEPVHDPDEGGVGEEKPFAVHAKTAREALAETSEYAPDLAAEGICVAIAPDGPEAGKTCESQQDDDPPEAEAQAGGQRGPDLLDEEAAETVDAADYDYGQQQEHDQKFPSPFEHDGAEDLVVGDLRSAGDDSAADEFADAGEDEVGYVADVHSVESSEAADRRVEGKEELTPSYGPEPEGERSGRHGEEDEFPAACLDLGTEFRPFDFTERNPKKKDGESGRSYVFKYLFYADFHIHGQIYPKVC